MFFSWLKNIKTKKTLLAFLLIFIIIFLGVFALETKSAKAALEDVRIPVLGHAIGGILWVIQWILGKQLYLIANIDDWILSLGDFAKVGIVTIGWGIVRDLANLFFVLILMAIAFATILRIDSYGLKALLPKLIIAALLINFSLVIGGVIIDFTQVLTDFFIEKATAGSSVSETLMEGLSVHKLYQVNDSVWAKIWKIAAGPSFAQVAELFFSIIILFVAVLVFVAFGGFLLVRIIALWLLLILAPIVWLLWILPGTIKAWNDWWRSFLKWAFFAPIYAFFLYVVLRAIQEGTIEKEITKGVKIADGEVFSSVFASNFEIIIQYVFIVIMLLAGLVVAQKLGIHGAGYAMTTAKFFGKGAAGWTSRQGARIPMPFSRRMGEWIARRGAERAKGRKDRGLKEGRLSQRLKTMGSTLAETRGRGVFSPGAWKRAWPEISKERERRAYAVRSAELQDQLTTILSLGREKSDYTERTKRQQRIDERRKTVTINAEELVADFKDAATAGLSDKAGSKAQALAEQGDLNDLLEKGYGYNFNAEGISKFTEEVLKPLMGEQDAYRLMFDLNRANEKVGQWPGRVFKAEYDEEKGRMAYKNVVKESIKDTGTANRGVEEALKQSYLAWSRMDPQEKARFTHRLGIISENEKGESTGVKDHEMFIRGFSAAQPNVVRIQDEVKATLMLRHAEETKKLNPELFNQLSEIFEKMDKEQIEKMEEMLQPVAPGVKVTSWTKGGGIITK